MNVDDLEDLIKALEQAPTKLAKLLNQLSPEGLKLKMDDEFSALESVCHLRDIEIEGYGERIVRILQEDEPSLPDIDGARLALERVYNSQDPLPALDAFSRARHTNVELVRTLSREQFERKAKLEGVGMITLEQLLEMMNEHDQGHLAELMIISRRNQSSSSGAI